MFDWQAHTAAPLLSRQIEFGPHGDGLHMSTGKVDMGVGLQAINALPE